MLRTLLTDFKRGSEHLNWGRRENRELIQSYSPKLSSYRILDVGPGEGFDLVNAKAILEPAQVELLGVECYDEYIKILQNKGIRVAKLNIEREPLPFADGSIDIIIANQIIEHTKEIFWIFSEFSRVLKPGGIAIVGVPNLASLHNRLMLLLGMQPSSIEMLGPHVRGITKPSFERFITTDSYFEVLNVRGANFYPFPPFLAVPLSKLLPTFSVSLFFCLMRTHKPGTFIDVLKSRFFETNFYAG